MRLLRHAVPITFLVALATAGPAAAAVPHTVAQGETLWSIAAASNLTTRALAAYNGLPEDGVAVLGSTIQVPSPGEAAAAMAAAGLAPTNPAAPAAAPAGHAHAATTAAAPAHAHGASDSAPQPMGGYTVRRGDTLTGLARTARVPAAQIAAMNGLDPSAPLLAGTVVKLPTGAPTPPSASAPAPATTVVPPAEPHPTATTVSADEIHRIAEASGVPGSLAAAIAWQESGFNNSMVSSANARGVMQIMPGTWDYIQQNLSQVPLNPASAQDNVRAGVMYLGRLLRETGGDENTAIAGYYQGLGAVRSRGLFDDTKRYVANVQALRSRFGG